MGIAGWFSCPLGCWDDIHPGGRILPGFDLLDFVRDYSVLESRALAGHIVQTETHAGPANPVCDLGGFVHSRICHLDSIQAWRKAMDCVPMAEPTDRCKDTT